MWRLSCCIAHRIQKALFYWALYFYYCLCWEDGSLEIIDILLSMALIIRAVRVGLQVAQWSRGAQRVAFSCKICFKRHPGKADPFWRSFPSLLLQPFGQAGMDRKGMRLLEVVIHCPNGCFWALAPLGVWNVWALPPHTFLGALLFCSGAGAPCCLTVTTAYQMYI